MFEQALHVRGLPPPPAPPEAWERGDFPYRIESYAGRGASGFVWKALPRLGGSPVALKLIPFRGEAERLRYRWAIEVSSLEKLVHPNLVRLAAHGLAADGTSGWLALEWIEGTSLSDVLHDQGSIPWRAALDLGLQACDALAAIHAAGLVHRDVKPANLLVERDTGRLVVADLGISLNLAENSDARLTRTIERAATPGYAPPEQFSRDYAAAPTDDQFSLAVTLWEMITGTRPAGAFPRLQSVSKSPPALDRVLRRALDPLPARRFPSITGFAKALRQSTRWHASWWKPLVITLLAATAILSTRHFAASSSPTPAAEVKFPLRLRSGTLTVPGAEKAFMSADVTLSKDGRFRGYIKTFTEDHFRGFTGFIIVALRDRHGNIISQFHSADMGVNGKWIPGHKPSRTDNWDFSIPPEIAIQVASADFHASIASRPWSHRLKENKEDISKGVRKLLNPDPAPPAPVEKK